MELKVEVLQERPWTRRRSLALFLDLIRIYDNPDPKIYSEMDGWSWKYSQYLRRGSPEQDHVSIDPSAGMASRLSPPKDLASSIRLWGPSIWQRSNQTPCRHFSSSESQCYPRKARNNPHRGMSAIRGTGIPPWMKLSVTTADLRSNTRTELPPQESPNHGLWGFFNKGRTMLTVPYDETQHGMTSKLLRVEHNI